jgi:hypothetical protein
VLQERPSGAAAAEPDRAAPCATAVSRARAAVQVFARAGSKSASYRGVARDCRKSRRAAGAGRAGSTNSL